MTQDPSIGNNLGPVQGPGSQSGSRPNKVSGDGAAFKVLLEKLESQARRLKEVGDTVERPEELAGAVDRARASIDDALSLGDQILEAYRAAVQTDEVGRKGDSEHERRDS